MAFALTPRTRCKTPVSMTSLAGRKKSRSQVRFDGSDLRPRGVEASAAPLIQTKLKIGQPNDKFEQEADRIADVVMRMPDGTAAHDSSQVQTGSHSVHPSSANASSVQRMCSKCDEELQRQPMDDDDTELQTKKDPGVTSQATPHVESQIAGLRGGGQPLPKSLRAFFEPRFGYDFSQVRVHSNDRAGGDARSVGARAFTVGSNVAFGAGEFASSTSEGRRLVAHELVHVIQQHGGQSSRHAPEGSLQRSALSLSQISDNSRSGTIQRDVQKKAGSGGQQIVIIAGGYKSASAAEEIKAAQSGLWLPGTQDFAITASDTQKSYVPASDADQLFGALQQAKGKISRIVFIGHGNPYGFGLAGTPDDFFQKGLVEQDITRWQSSINSDIKPKLTADATFDIYACNLALKEDFLKALAQALGICVRAFPKKIYWCMGYDKGKVTSRGKLAASHIAAECSDSRWSTGVNSFTPPNRTCPVAVSGGGGSDDE